MSGAAVAVGGATPAKIPARAVIAVVIGNWLEFYDFIVYTFFAVMIGHTFFPAELMAKEFSKSEADFLSLLASLATFGAGFFTRPIGAAVIGAYADRAGRRAAMTVTILLMALGTAMVALTPGYAQIGMAAPVILVVARLIQGFSCGGEVGPATTYLLESAAPNQRAALTAWQGISQQFAGIMGTVFGLALAATLSKEDLYDWGWRVPFLIGILIGPVGLYIRRMLPETIEKHETHESGVAVLKHLFAHSTIPVVLTVLCIVGPTVSTYVSNYMTTYAITTLKLPAETGMFATLCGYIVSLVGIPLGAWAADRIGYKVSVLVPRILFCAIVYQAYVMLTAPAMTIETLIGVSIVLNFILALANGGLYALVTQAFPKAVRSSGLSVAYALSVTVFGGTTQFIVTWLIHQLNDPLVPAWYQIGANAISIVAVLLITAHAEARPTIQTEAPG